MDDTRCIAETPAPDITPQKPKKTTKILRPIPETDEEIDCNNHTILFKKCHLAMKRAKIGSDTVGPFIKSR